MPKQTNDSGFGPQRTEMTFAGILTEWINTIIEKEHLSFGRAEVENKEPGRPNRADIILYRSPTSHQVLCIIECKQPYENVFSVAVIEQASGYARHFSAPFFATCNGRTLAWFDEHEHTEKNLITAGHLKSFSLTSGLRAFSDLSPKNRLDIQNGVRVFLFQLHEHWYQNKPLPLTEINEFFVLRLQTTIEQLFGYYLDLVQQRIEKDQKFLERLQEWFVSQEWSFTFQPQAYEIVARQASYLLVNKLILYSALQQQWGTLDQISIGRNMKHGGKLLAFLELHFTDVLRVDYQTIFSTDSLNIGFPEDGDAVEVIRILLEDLNRYHLGALGYEIIGSLFERLIPQRERHKLGQYSTPGEVVDLMLMCCTRNTTDTIFDPAVGAGTFLVRAYQYKFLQGYHTTHEDLLRMLWGCDIVPFPAHLAAINLAIRGLSSRSNFPRILHRDFFKLTPETLSFPLPVIEEVDEGFWTPDVNVQHRDEIPDPFDVVVCNPPYTRQEFLGDLMPSETYKQDLIKQVFHLSDGTRIPPFSKRAGFHMYFFVHAAKFLKEGGRMAFVTSNSWLNADYGSDLQAYLLDHFKILAIMESDSESWFPEVNVDNCIVILEKCSGDQGRDQRDTNLIHFVRFHVPLIPDIVPTADDEASQRKRFHTLKRVTDLILAEEQSAEYEQFRIYPKLQKKLLEEGYDPEKKQYIGSRWGKFTTAPAIWYTLTDPLQSRLIPLSTLAELRYGLKTGINKFFYATEDTIQKYGIEQEYWGETVDGVFVPHIVMKSPHESRTVQIDQEALRLRVLTFHAPAETLTYTHAWSYIQAGEHMGWSGRSTSAERQQRQAAFGWYDLGDHSALPKATILWPKLSGVRSKKKVFYAPFPVIVNDKLYTVLPHDSKHQELLAAVLNSTIVDFMSEFESTRYGGWAGAPGDLALQAARRLLIPDIRNFTTDQQERIVSAFRQYRCRSIGSLAEEYGVVDGTTLSLHTIAPDLHLIDSIVMGEVLGLSEHEQLTIYQTLLQLSKRRVGKMQQAGKQQRSHMKRELDEDAFLSTVLMYVADDIEHANTLYKQMLAGRETCELEVISSQDPLFRGKPQLQESLWGYKLILGPQTVDYPSSAYIEALYRQAWALVRVSHVKMPVPIQPLAAETQSLFTILERLDDTVKMYTSKVRDAKVRQQVSSRLWAAIKQRLTDLSDPGQQVAWSKREETG